MIATRTWHDRLPSAAAAIALQAGVFALLAFSFAVVRHADVEKENFITLPPLARPAPAPMRIDARGGKRPAIAPSPSVPESAAVAAPAIAAPAAPGQAQADCVPEGQARSAARRACPPPVAQAETNEIPLHPESHVKNAPIWQSEIDRRNTPPRVPCVSLTNNVTGLDGFHREDRGARLDITCALKTLREGPTLLPPVSGAPDPNPAPQHASDDAFRQALQAANDRKRALYARPAPPPDAQSGASP